MGRRTGMVALGLLAALLALVLATLLETQESDSESRGVEQVPGEVASEDPAVEELVHATEERSERRIERAATAIPEPANEQLEARETWTLRGRALRVDSSGDEFTREAGSFLLVFETEHGFDETQVVVSDGEWSATLPPTSRIWPKNLLLAGHALATSDEGLDVEPNSPVRVVGHMLHDVRLYVNSKATGIQLQGIDVVRGGDFYGDQAAAPRTPRALLVERASSPIVLPAVRDSADQSVQFYWVRATGCAWSSIEIDHASAGDRELRLGPAGSLEVRWLGRHDLERVKLRVHDENAPGWPVAVVDTTERSVVLESLPVSTFGVSVFALEDAHQGKAPLGRARATLEAGTRTIVEISLSEVGPAATPVRIAGTLLLPAGYEEVEAELVLAFVRTSKDVPPILFGPDPRGLDLTLREMRTLGNGLFGFEGQLASSGSYLLLIKRLGWGTVLEVPEGGRSDIHLRLPGLAHVLVELIGAQSREPLDKAHLAYATESTMVSRAAKPVVDRPGSFEFITVSSTLTFFPRVEGYDSAIVERDAPAGESRFVLELERECGFALSFKDGDATVPMYDGVRFAVTNLDGVEVRLGWTEAGEVFLPAPGSYLLSFTDFEGFEDLEDLELTLERREFAAVEIQLTRAE